MRRHRRDEDAGVITHVGRARDQVDEGVRVITLLAEGLLQPLLRLVVVLLVHFGDGQPT